MLIVFIMFLVDWSVPQFAAMEATLNNTDIGSDPKPPVVYRCKKCRRIVATEEHIVSHERGGGQRCFKWKKRNVDEDVQALECSSIFVEPMKWMQACKSKLNHHSLLTIGITFLEKSLYICFFVFLQWKKAVWETSFNALVVMPDWVPSIGQVCSAIVGHGLILHFSCTKAVWTSALPK